MGFAERRAKGSGHGGSDARASNAPDSFQSRSGVCCRDPGISALSRRPRDARAEGQSRLCWGYPTAVSRPLLQLLQSCTVRGDNPIRGLTRCRSLASGFRTHLFWKRAMFRAVSRASKALWPQPGAAATRDSPQIPTAPPASGTGRPHRRAPAPHELRI